MHPVLHCAHTVLANSTHEVQEWPNPKVHTSQLRNWVQWWNKGEQVCSLARYSKRMYELGVFQIVRRAWHGIHFNMYTANCPVHINLRMNVLTNSKPVCL